MNDRVQETEPVKPVLCTICGKPLEATYVMGAEQWICVIHSTRGVPK